MVITETDAGSLRVISQAVIIDDSTDKAWAEKYIRENKHQAWILGKYVEADQANSNRQFFALDDLASHIGTLVHSPLNIGHTFPPVGTFVGAELMYPTGEGDEADVKNPFVEALVQNPFVEALSVMWKTLYPDEFKAVEAAYKTGKLAYSMEARAETVTCGGEGGCGQTFKYVGRVDPSYCAHINNPNPEMAKVLSKPHFMGGALIIPPVMPGWQFADVTQMASLDSAEAERTYEAISEEFKDLDPSDWEDLMASIMTSHTRVD